MFWWWPFGKAPEVEARTLREQLRKDRRIQLVDVRSAGEFAQGHIKGAKSAPIQSLKKTLPNLNLDPARPVIVVCQTAHRSVPGVRLLRQQGFDAQQLGGGMNAWRAAGFPETKK
ncbi:MAG: rhodanese-like domain-containing protein [Caldilineaceae bacterium]|nr:rhodanese-like domain-containing protein [Caldilineaceae bacterium]